jgi:hypothetical protein
MANEVNVIIGMGGLGITGIRNYARAEIALHGTLPPNVLLVEIDLCSLTGRDEERTIADLVPPEQYLVLHAPDVNIGARCAALAPNDPIRTWVSMDAVSDIGNTGAIGGNQRPVILELVAHLEPKWWEGAVAGIGQAIRNLADMHGLSLGTVRVKILRSTLGTVGAAGIIFASSLQAGLRQINTCIIDTVALLADHSDRVPDRRRARASTAAALDEIDRRARGLVIGQDDMFGPVSGIHMLSEGFSEIAVLTEDAVVNRLMVAGKLDGPLVAPLTLRNNTQMRAEATTAITGRLMVADPTILYGRLVARIAARATETFATIPGSLSLDAQVEALLNSALGRPSALVDSIGRSHGLRNASRRLVAEIVGDSSRQADREVFARADGVLDEDELKASVESKVYTFTLVLKNAADRAMDTSLRDSLGFFSTGISCIQRYREELVHLKESREQDAASCRNKINAAAGQVAAAEAARNAPTPRQTLWRFVKNALKEEEITATPATLDDIRAKYIAVRGDLQTIGALIAAVDQGVSVLRTYEMEQRALRDLVLSTASTFDQIDSKLGQEAVERIRRFTGVNLAAEDEVIEALASARTGCGCRVASGALARLGATEIASIGRTSFERAVREEVEDVLGSAEAFSLNGVVAELPDELLDRLARSLVSAKAPVAFDPRVRAPEVFSVAHVGNPRMAAAIRRTNFGRSKVMVYPAPDDNEYFAVTYTGVFSVRDLECYGRAKAAFEEAREEGWAAQIVDLRVLEMPDDGTDDGTLKMLIAKAALAGTLQATPAGTWYHVEAGSGISPANMDPAALHAAFRDSLGSSIAGVVRTLRSEPALRRALRSEWDDYAVLRSPRQMVDLIDAALASRKLRKLSGCYGVLKAEFLKALKDNAFEEACGDLRSAAGRNGGREEMHVTQ